MKMEDIGKHAKEGDFSGKTWGLSSSIITFLASAIEAKGT
jgi:hypothetical protein